jgi:hypothetical protein
MNKFPNRAGHKDDALDAELIAELTRAGIDHFVLPFRYDDREVKTRVIGSLHGWKFERAWYYWVATGPGIPQAAAAELYASHGKEARAAGDCACRPPESWYHGLGVGMYHVDTPEGLKALAETIKKVVAPYLEKVDN